MEKYNKGMGDNEDMMFFGEVKRSLETLAEAQILVVGGGPAGIAAATAAARIGVKTILVESGGYFGGNITRTGVESAACFRSKNTVEAGGIFAELEADVRKLTESFYENLSGVPVMDPELFKIAADRLLLSAKVIPILHCAAADAIVDELHRIRGIVVQSKSGRQAVYGQRVIDCTGDADVAMLAGAPVVQSPKSQRMGVTPMFQMAGVNTQRFLNYIENELKPTYHDWGDFWNMQMNKDDLDRFAPCISKCLQKAARDGLLPGIPDVRFGGEYGIVTRDGMVSGMNLILIGGIDCTDVMDLTRAEMAGREYAMMVLKALRRYLPGFESARISGFSASVGTRESRRILGHYLLTGADVLDECRFPDSIGVIPEFLDGRGLLVAPTTGRYLQIPYRALLPQKVGNLLVAGRCISGDEIAHCAFRSIVACFATGQGAGVAAAVSVLENTTAQNVKIADVQSALMSQKVRVF